MVVEAGETTIRTTIDGGPLPQPWLRPLFLPGFDGVSRLIHHRADGRRQWEVGPPVIYSWLGTGWRRTRRILRILLRHCRGRSAGFVTWRGEDDSEHRGPLICDWCARAFVAARKTELLRL
jgi:hypothetical protein